MRDPPRPLLLPPNRVARFYRGGAALAALRGEPGSAGDGELRVPEDWVGSVTDAFGEPGVGPSRLGGDGGGALLRDAIAEDPPGWLGAAHVARWGADPALLVKLLDAGDRLPVHVHPEGPFARARLGLPFGKTEAWVVVGGSGPVWLGWREPVSRARLERWVAEQDAGAMLAALHRIEPSVGDALFVPAGVAHAIGAGLVIAELQEPSDMSVLLEWDGHGIAGEPEATLGLGWEAALDCVRLKASEAPEPGAPRAPGTAVTRLLAEVSDPFFRAEAIALGGGELALERGFGVLLGLDGAGELRAAGEALPLRRGDNAVIPYAAGDVRLAGTVRALRCRPPRPDAPEDPAQ